ncbi:hypothetical protein D4R42_04475 [bacterium]|nr:MAG: hypothetical protein D4R42_04475 [bacterium]
MSFKPENLHPLAGIAIPTLIGVMVDKTTDGIDLFEMFETTLQILEVVGTTTAAVTGALAVWSIWHPTVPISLLTLECGILTLALTVCYMHISATKWWVFERAKAYHEAVAKIIEEFYGIDMDKRDS